MTPSGADDPAKIRITLDDLDQVELLQPKQIQGPQSYGSIDSAPEAPVMPDERGSVFMRSWVYLGLAGFLGAFLAWAVCEPWFIDGPHQTWASFLLFPLMLVLMCVGFGIAESVVDRSTKRAIIRGALSLGLGSVLGLFLNLVANVIFAIGLGILAHSGEVSSHSPALWIIRSIAWAVFGIGGGIVYGIVGQSVKRCLFGVLGGVLGAGIGGLVFDPIALVFGGGGASRFVGMSLFGAATGVAIGLVESALKDRWLYVAAGPLAGKQFILYKPVSVIGSDPSSDLYLFKDPAIERHHAHIELQGPRVLLRPFGAVLIDGKPVGATVLHSGAYIQIGRYGFHYRDRERKNR